jgi:hypothetical protein
MVVGFCAPPEPWIYIVCIVAAPAMEENAKARRKRLADFMVTSSCVDGGVQGILVPDPRDRYPDWADFA